MENKEPTVIEKRPDGDGRVILELYGEKIEIDDNMFNADGEAKITVFGDPILVKCAEKSSKKAARRAEKAAVASDSASEEVDE